jgi:aminoglycoside phosphotransferase family enzyme
MDPAGEMTEARGSPEHRGPSASGLPLLVEAMMRPEFYPDSPARVEVKQTHISYLFIAGDFVYKVKKPVHFPFLDCSKLADRLRHLCMDTTRQREPLAAEIEEALARLTS